MSSFDGSEEEEEFSPQQKSTRVSLRQRGGVNYNEKALYKLDEELEQELADSPLVKKSKKKNYKKIISQKYEGYDDDEDDEKDKNGSSADENTDAATDANYGTSEVGGIFFPEIDQILFRREMKDQPGKMEYLVKYKDWSYLHVDWLEEKDVINETTSMKNKLNRFNKAFDRKVMEGEIDEETIAQERYFDPTYVEVDRIIHTTELFPVIHPKKSNEIKGKWTESLVLVVNKLLNFTKDTVHYGIHFQEPVNPERDGCPNYKKIITYPMDLGSLLNRLYLDFYKNQQNVWHDLGFVFKNARKYNKDPDSDIRILSDTLRECAVFLYREWYKAQKQKYEDLKHDYYMRTDLKYREEKQNQYITEFKKEFSKFTLEEIGGLKKIMKEFINQKQDETMEFQEQLDEFIQIYEEKPGFEAEVYTYKILQQIK
ncbi:Chromo domain protein [Pseudocohnilembus persalinus]|uniref:Chromo domain protein n=1 Tax=Pseudocohnilembus persalinus TaxID=266149 RepID=A0A0V0QSD6_PSEPJ|nr:Chromo domain protein [Pseudocohnilembus persalinus]|eukprot:KRX04912.1 Chromo domain protein [Pseudocohnilembus persalinus]